MGWRDRTYHREDPWQDQVGGPTFRWPAKAAGALIITHLLAFMLLAVLSEGAEQDIAALLMLTGENAPLAGILLHPLSTQNGLTLLLAVIFIWMLGSRAERERGAGQMLALYLAGTLLAGAAYFLVARLSPALAGAELDYPVGAFAAWITGSIRGAPTDMVMVLGKPRRLGHVLGVVIAILAGLMFAMHGLGAVAWLAAAGAGIGADFVVHRNSSLRDLAQRFRWPRRRRPRSASSVGRASARSAEPDIDDILAKISQSGLDSLTEDERSRLEAARQAKLRHGSDVNTLS